MVKWCSNGSIEYHGRADEQIKIRGFRIEISEIESCLEKIHAIYQCLVKPEKTPEGAVFLSAYLVLLEDTQISAHELRTALKKELPDYMIPSRFYIVEQLLFTPNGKLDRKHTPTPIKKLTLATEQHRAPGTQIQKQLHSIWVSILKNEELGIHDDFFEQGGHSLLAMQIIARIHEELSIKLSIRALFDYPNIGALSQEIERMHHKNTFDSTFAIQTMIPLKKSGHKTPLFLIHPVGGSVFWYTALGKQFDKERPLYGIQDPGLETQKFLFEHLEEMASCYINNIKRIQPHGAYLIGGASFGATVAIEIAKQLQNQNEDVEAIISLDGWAEYPALQSSEAHFKTLMQEQNTRLLEHYQRNNLQQADFLLEMQWHREQMLMHYTMPRIKAPLILFKANHLSPLFQYDAPLNWWDQYTDLPITCYLTPGDHETMFYEEHSKVLAQLIYHSLMDKNNE